MRCDAIDVVVGGRESAASCAPAGEAGTAPLEPPAAVTSPAAAMSAIAARAGVALPKRRTCLLVEEVEACHVDRDLDLLIDPR